MPEFIKIKKGLGIQKWKTSVRVTDSNKNFPKDSLCLMVNMENIPSLLEAAFECGVSHQKEQIRKVLLP